MNFSKYNAKDVVITVDGVHITGLGENMWNFEKNEALAENSVGAQGDVCRTEKNDPLHKAIVTVQRTSPQYNFLASLKDRTEPFPVWCNNKALGIKEGGSMALVDEKPASSFGATADDAEFAFTVYDGETIIE